SVSDARFEVTNGQLRVKASQMLPSSPGTVSVTLTATDNEGLSLSKSFTLSVVTVPGTLDFTFGTNGYVTQGPERYGYPRKTLVLADGKLLVLASYITDRGDIDVALARYQPNGTLDATFGTGGLTYATLGPANDSPIDMRVQPDGSVIVVGDSDQDPNGRSMFITRFSSNGTGDGSFGSNGVIFIPMNMGINYGAAVVHTDGKVTYAGVQYERKPESYYNTVNTNFVLIRVLPDGTPDATFGTNGSVLIPVDDENAFISRLLIEPNGRAVLAVRSASTGDSLTRLNVDGSIDATFGSSGRVVMTDISLALLDRQPDGKLLVAGQGSNPSNGSADFAIRRFNLDGLADGTFGMGGLVRTDFFGRNDNPEVLAVQSDGKILLGGARVQDATYKDNIVLVRYTSQGTLDSSFGTGGITVTPHAFDSAGLYSVSSTATGIVLAGSSAFPYVGYRFLLTRYVP
ncbi:hypothetical protein, partial [Deinococcus yavapaiensis]